VKVTLENISLEQIREAFKRAAAEKENRKNETAYCDLCDKPFKRTRKDRRFCRQMCQIVFWQTKRRLEDEARKRKLAEEIEAMRPKTMEDL
jgi:CRISPR/Cas system type I-B associated protein Csh2 (Cas7 group RAMP superfamily)